MSRPYLQHQLSIISGDILSFFFSISSSGHKSSGLPSSPVQSLGLLKKKFFIVKIRGYDTQQKLVFEKNFESNAFGQIFERSSLDNKTVKVIKVYEIKTFPGRDVHLGTFFPLELPLPKKIIITDFDKTLVDTKYSTTKELYHSLTKPLQNFPTLHSSMTLLNDYISKGFHPFILTASPNFYENAIRDWLLNQHLYQATLFSKDYRQIFSLFHGPLRFKDLKAQGYYKLSQLLRILWLTGLPKELVLMGDGFEADPMIYLTLKALLTSRQTPHSIWNDLKNIPHFNFSLRQNSEILEHIYSLSDRRSQLDYPIKVTIHIRQKSLEDKVLLPTDFLRQDKASIHFYTDDSFK